MLLFIEGWQHFDNAYRDAVTSIRGIRNDCSGNREFVEEHRSNFKRKCSTKASVLSKKPKSSSWTQKFICLSGTSDDRVPTTSVVREALSLAGLGEKKIQIYDVDCSTEAFHEILINAFPKLKTCGGFELLRCVPSTRDLELIPSPVCHSPQLLRSRIGTVRIYIRPIQADLDIEVENISNHTHQVSVFTVVIGMNIIMLG